MGPTSRYASRALGPKPQEQGYQRVWSWLSLLTLPLIYAGRGRACQNPQRAYTIYALTLPLNVRAGLRASKLENHYLFILTLLQNIEYQLSVILSNFYCQGTNKRTFKEQKLILQKYCFIRQDHTCFGDLGSNVRFIYFVKERKQLKSLLYPTPFVGISTNQIISVESNL